MQTCLQSRPMVAAVAALGQRVGLRLAFEVGAGHVVQQQVVLELEQLAQPALEMGLQLLLVRQQAVQRAIQAIVVDRLGRHAQQVVQRRAAIPMLGDVQLARRLAQPGDHQDRRHRRPRHPLAAARQRLATQLVERQAPATAASPARHRRTAASDPGAPAPAAPSPARRRALASNRSYCSGRPLIRSASWRARARPCPSSSPRCATVSCLTRLPRRTERTSRQ